MSSYGETRLEIRRDGDATVIGYMRKDGLYGAMRSADDSDVETVVDQLRGLAEAMVREPWDFGGSFNSGRRRR